MAENEAPEDISNFNTLFLEEANDTTPTVSLSGAIYISGGMLCYKGFEDTVTILGVA